MTRLWGFLSGHLLLRVEGRGLEKFINLATNRGIYLWDIQKAGNVLLARVSIAGFRQIRPVARKTRSRVKIVKKLGLPFYWQRAHRRRGLVLGAILFILALIWLSSFIWVVEVKGTEKVDPREILRVVEQEGLRRGTLRWGLDLKRLERQVLKRVDGLTWVGITVKGARAVVEVVEKTLPPADPGEDAPVNIVAARAGLITKLLVFKGQPVVQEGQVVKKGQLLVRSVVTAGEKLAAPKPMAVRARAAVIARVWYNGYAEVSRTKILSTRTGQKVNRHSIKIRGREIILHGRQEIPFNEYEEEQRLWRVGRNLHIPVEVITTRYYEVHRRRQKLSVEEAAEEARELALQGLRPRIPPAAEILQVKADVVQSTEDVVGVRVTVETEEDIGMAQIIKG